VINRLFALHTFLGTLSHIIPSQAPNNQGPKTQYTFTTQNKNSLKPHSIDKNKLKSTSSKTFHPQELQENFKIKKHV